mmetsp:Transcript_9365/g.34360  ORF Transcript_9365/g.34360 Transcript_9365/m.34360 type:complete len:340 (+) Transcript_9365:118-1137(+)
MASADARRTESGPGSMPYLIFIVIGYSISSSCLTILNKYAMVVFPFAGFLTAFQFLTSAAAVWLLGKMGYLTVEGLQWDTVKAFLPAVILYYVSIFTNTKVLEYANVDTFIVFRSACPIAVAVIEVFVLKSPWPNPYTGAALFVILLGAIAYVLFDSEFDVRSYSWATAYVCAMTTDMVLIKKIVNEIGLSTWGLVYYNNLLAFLMFPIATFLTGEMSRAVYSDAEKPAGLGSLAQFEVLWPVLLSCLGGLSISFFGFSCRKAFSATAFTVVGVVNKFGTVFINTTIWARHATPGGICSMLVCIGGGVLYQQSFKMNARPRPLPAKDVENSSGIPSQPK